MQPGLSEPLNSSAVRHSGGSGWWTSNAIGSGAARLGKPGAGAAGPALGALDRLAHLPAAVRRGCVIRIRKVGMLQVRLLQADAERLRACRDADQQGHTERLASRARTTSVSSNSR
jgi:hypothetical protein